jgi:hypothetical protein
MHMQAEHGELFNQYHLVKKLLHTSLAGVHTAACYFPGTTLVASPAMVCYLPLTRVATTLTADVLLGYSSYYPATGVVIPQELP